MPRTRIEALGNTETWETQTGDIVRFDEMDLAHARNLHAWLLRRASLFHNSAIHAFEAREFDLEPEEWMRATPLHQRVTRRIEELEALDADAPRG